MDDFDWNEDEAVCLREYGSIAIHLNEYDDIVIRQRNSGSTDSVVIIPRRDVEYIASEIIDVYKSKRA